MSAGGSDLSLNENEFKLLRDYIEQHCGIALDSDKMYLVESRLIKLVIESQSNSFHDFYLKAKNDLAQTWKNKIVDAMTTNETLWFRDEHPYITLRDVIFPEMIKKKMPVRIWSAACSSGQEPYSIAMMAHEASRRAGDPFLINGGLTIIGTDICSSILFVAKAGRYNGLAMSRGMMDGIKERYFTEQGAIATINDDVKKMVHFQSFNLQDSFATLGSFDIVFLRNVAIYFSADFKREIFKKIAQSLKPNGYLFLGASESLIGYSEDFKVQENGKTLYYQLK